MKVLIKNFKTDDIVLYIYCQFCCEKNFNSTILSYHLNKAKYVRTLKMKTPEALIKTVDVSSSLAQAVFLFGSHKKVTQKPPDCCGFPLGPVRFPANQIMAAFIYMKVKYSSEEHKIPFK